MDEQKTDCTSRALDSAAAVWESVNELASVCRDLRRSHEAMSMRLRAAETWRSRAPDDALRERKTGADGVTYSYVDSVLVRAAVFHLVVDWLVAGCVEVDLRHVRDEILKLRAEAD